MVHFVTIYFLGAALFIFHFNKHSNYTMPKIAEPMQRYNNNQIS